MKIGLVTDSTSDLPVDLVEKYELEVVPAILVIENNSYMDGKGISRETFYEQLPNLSSPPSTAAPSVGAFSERYEKLLQKGAEQVLSIHPPSTLSGIFNAARLAAEPFGERVHVLDSGQISLGLGFQVLAAAEAVARGAIPDQIHSIIDRVRRNVHVYALLDTLEYLRRSGRVSWTRAALGELLSIKPLVELREGQVLSSGRARTRKQGIALLVHTLRSIGLLERLAILHTNAGEDAEAVLREVDQELQSPALIVNVTTVIGTHVGPNGLGFAAVKA